MNWWYLYCEKCQWCGELNTAYPPGCPNCRNPQLIHERGEDGEKPTRDGIIASVSAFYASAEEPEKLMKMTVKIVEAQ